jgi:hypothetical protein
VRDRLRDMWIIARGRVALYRSPFYGPGECGDWDDPGPHEHETSVPLVPRAPTQSGAVALPLPEAEEWDVDAFGRAADGTG